MPPRKDKSAASRRAREKGIRENPVDTSHEIVYETLGIEGLTSKRLKISEPEYTQPRIVIDPAPSQPAPPTAANVEEESEEITRNARIIADCLKIEAELGEHILNHEADAKMGTPCHCGSGALRMAMCHECTEYPPSCIPCFGRDHKYNYFHWAEIWNVNKGFYVRHEMSVIAPPLQIGHYADPCANVVSGAEPATLIITHTNGIHEIKAHFCGHTTESRVYQLMRARLFPATFDTPRSAVTFAALKQFQIHHLESKSSAYDYCGSLMRLTDHAFAATNVKETYENFIRASRLWAMLTTKKRMGQMHRIDDVLPYRPKGNLVLYCPACPEPGFNMDKKMPRQLPPELRHLNQERLTEDGNFHCNKAKKSSKNSDPKDTSLYVGKSYFPEQAAQKAYLAQAPKSQEAKIDVHVFVRASVDLEAGERLRKLIAVSSRFVNVDSSLAHGLKQKIASGWQGGDLNVEIILEMESIDRIMSYDIACQYHIHVVSRFKQSFPDLAGIVENMRWAVPLVHVQGHQAGCISAYSSTFMLAAGHFHGETAEQYWPELNQIGPKVRQMNYGHRQDTVINHHGDWNQKKMSKIVVSLIDELNDGKSNFKTFQAHFFGLCTNLVRRIESENWFSRDRTPRRVSAKVVKMPTQLAIYNQMLSDEAAVSGTNVQIGKAAPVLKEGISIQETQSSIRQLLLSYKEQPLTTTRKEIDKRRTKARARIARWREAQIALMPAIAELLLERAACSVEDETLFLPSDFELAKRLELNLVGWAKEEAKLREALAYDSLKSVQVVTKALVAMGDRKRKHESGQNAHTKALGQLEDAERRRDKHIGEYMGARAALMRLQACTGEHDDFPELTVKDTFMPSRTAHRGLGKSRNRDGWTAGAVTVGGKIRISAAGETSSQLPMPKPGATVMAERRDREKAKGKAKEIKPKPARVSVPKKLRNGGWLWKFGKMGKMTEEEMKAWSEEGDRVQWFRAEADMLRWQEQVEQKLAEIRTTIRSFAAYKEAWTRMASLEGENSKSRIGHIAYAKQKADMFRIREDYARAALRTYPEYACLEPDDADLYAFVVADRKVHADKLASVIALAKAAADDAEAEGAAAAADDDEEEGEEGD
ncbi:hypothetical protein B0H11DRAFT_1912979 [Mycena galericulata]|nr:hypothetical protein B0H11DRAFT_1912979 [Mycena galericulata]